MFASDTIPEISSKAYAKSYLTDSKDILSFPVRWNNKQWITSGIIVASTGILISADEQIRDVFQRNQTKTFDFVAKYVAEPWGTNKLYKNYALLTSAGFFLYGTIGNDTKAKKCALSGIKAFALTGAFTYVPKSIFGRQRPNSSNNPDRLNWQGPFKGESFFSGHTSVSFAFATVISEYYKERPVIPIIAYTFSTLTGLQRMYDDKHWSSDVFAGAAFGIAIGKLIARNDRNITLSLNSETLLPQLTYRLNF